MSQCAYCFITEFYISYMFVPGKKCLCKESVTVCLRDSPMESMHVN